MPGPTPRNHPAPTPFLSIASHPRYTNTSVVQRGTSSSLKTKLPVNKASERQDTHSRKNGMDTWIHSY